MLNIDIFSDFIAVGAKKGISKYASAIMPKNDFEDGMSGYDIESFVKFVVKNQGSNILENFILDSEYGMFCMYYKVRRVEITDEHIQSCIDLVKTLNNMIKDEYRKVVDDIDTDVYVYDVREKENKLN